MPEIYKRNIISYDINLKMTSPGSLAGYDPKLRT